MFIAAIVITFFFLVAISGSKKKRSSPTKKTYHPSPKAAHRPTPQPRISTQKSSGLQAKAHTSPYPEIIDVSGSAEPIPTSKTASSSPREVVPWPHHYIFSFNDLADANKQQQTYYYYFKQQFLQGHPPELGDNTNYAFVLLFDLLQTRDNKNDLRKLHDLLLLLARHYPKTASYAQREFDQLVLQQSNSSKPNPLAADPIPMADIYQPSWSSLGKRNKKTVAMSDEEASMLDQLFYSPSSFFENPFCQSAIVTLFLALLRSLDQEFRTTNRSLEQRIDEVARLVCKTHYNYRQDNEANLFNLRSVKNDVRQLLMKLCENAVRDQYEYKRRLQILPFYNSETVAEVNEALENQLLISACHQLTSLANVIPVPDDKGETALNTLSPTRWKQKFETIKVSYTQGKDAKAYKTEVIRLGKLNKTNPAVEHIYFEAAKFIGKEDKILCLTLYCYYIYHDQLSAKIDDKQLPKTLLKALFNTDNKETEFTNIINDLKKNKDLKATLATLPEIYAIKRKKIELDSTVIREAEHALDDTVELLNEYLADEDLSTVEESAAYHAQAGPIASADIEEEEPIDLQPGTSLILPSPASVDVGANANRYLSTIALNPIQLILLNTFENHGFSIAAEDLETFAREHNTFMSQLINNLNEAFFEHLDDSLIEEDEDHYTINQEYYKRILQP